ncbi:MAG: YbfB/YjiJ family MFS transporter [Pseudomonadota bacterium]
MTDRRVWAIALCLSLAPAVTNGLARFAYGLILPAMRQDLGWTFTEAGWVNTANAIGYLLGALAALALISRIGARRLFVVGMILTAVALLASAFARDLWAMSLWRILAGVGGAPAFIAGGALASSLFVGDKARNALVIAVYFGGGGLGMLATGAALPSMIEAFGPAAWPDAWLWLGAASVVCLAPSIWAARQTPDPTPAARRTAGRLPLRRMAPAFVAYFCFGFGYLIYVTFLVAWMRDEGAGAALISATWSVMGIAVMASPFLWRGVLAAAEGGRAIALTLLATGVGALIALAAPGPAGVLASALIFGASFFMVPTATTNFGRKNLEEAQWGPSLALFTTVFSVGQILGPVGAGALADYSGGVAPGLAAAAVILLAGAVAGAAQRPLAR